MTRGWLLAIVIVVLLLIIAYAAYKKPKWAHLEYWKFQLVEKPDKIYERSSGTFDEAAELALARTESAPAPSPEDHHRAATIITNNVLAQEQGANPAVDRREMFRRARAHRLEALAALTPQVVGGNAVGRAARRQNGILTDTVGPETIIDAAVNFAFGGLEILLGGANPIGDAGEIILLTPDGDIVNFAENRRENTISARKSVAESVVANAGGGGKGAKAEAYLDLSKQNTSDSQNSHDPSVNGAKKAIVQQLRKDQKDASLPTLKEIADQVRTKGPMFSRDPHSKRPRPALINQALGTIARAARGERSIAAGATDEEVLRRVWARADDPRNKKNRRKMQQSTFDALVDCWERGIGADELQCVDGRISRLLGSLALLDHDSSNWEMRRLEQHKNDIFEKAKDVLRKTAEEVADEDDEEMRKVGRSYLITTAKELQDLGEIDGAKEEEFRKVVRDKISFMVDKYASEHKGSIPDHAIEGIKKEAMAAV